MSDQHEDNAHSNSTVEPATGNFYEVYKVYTNGSIEFVMKIAAEAIASGELGQVDLHGVENGIARLRGNTADLFSLLEKSINKNNPTFFDEAAVEAIWSLLEGIFLVAFHTSTSDRARRSVQRRTTEKARAARAEKRKQRDDLLDEHLERVMNFLLCVRAC
ncbi:hypothetical protein [Methylobacterium sp. WSM2598]|uniref:hypothetical protein n=1 Tax=Methylobacterium sp. WSM2598 TaxID=398261 RepID=UPI0012F6400C|nr:hypothetical protein [Methylobacterium sp. WSM2598]